MRGVSAVDARGGCGCSRRSVTWRCTSSCRPFTRPPPAVVAGTDRSGCSRVRYVTVCNRLVVDEQRSGRRVARSGGRLAGPGTAGHGPKSQERSRRTAGRPSAESRSVIRLRVPWRDVSPGGSLWNGARRGTRRAPGQGRHWPLVSVGRHDRPRSPGCGGHHLPEVSRARDTSPPSRRRRWTPTPTGSRPARHPESEGLPRPEGVVDGRDAPGPQGQ